jgi:hypothetical protein
MRTLADRVYLDSQFDTVSELPRTGSALENPYVYDAVARDLGEMASKGLIKIVNMTRGDNHDGLVKRLTFQRLR